MKIACDLRDPKPGDLVRVTTAAGGTGYTIYEPGCEPGAVVTDIAADDGPFTAVTDAREALRIITEHQANA